MKVSEHDRESHDQHGFTVTEMLIGVALVLVLVALSLPVMRAVTQRGEAATCISQLRQIGQAMAAYLGESNGKFPPSVGGYYPEAGWAGIWYRPTTVAKPHGLGLAAYTGGEDQLMKLTVCPTSRSAAVVAPCINAYGYPYIVNYHLMASLPFPIADVRAVRQPSRTVVMADSVSGSQWALGTPTLVEAGGGWRLKESHQGQMNVLWADGHVSAKKKTQLTEFDFRFMFQSP